MKAIVRILKGGDAKENVAYLLDPAAKSKRDMMPAAMMTGSDNLEQTGERVAVVFGQGVDAKALAQKNEKVIVRSLEARPLTLYRKGKKTRHVAISALFEEGEELSDDVINEKLQFAAEDFIDQFCPGSKFLGVIHRDSSQPHVHLEIENYDSSISEPKRFDWMPMDVEEMQTMNWTEQFAMGKGSTKNAEKKLADDIAKAGRPLLGRKKLDIELGKEIESNLSDLSLRGDSLVDAVEKLQAQGFSVRRFSRRGALLKKPSVSFGGTTIVFRRLEKHLDAVLEFNEIVVTVAPEVAKSSQEIAVDFRRDYKHLIATCNNATGKTEADKKDKVRVPAVEEFFEKWSNLLRILTKVKALLKAELNNYLDQLRAFEKSDDYNIEPMQTHIMSKLQAIARKNKKAEVEAKMNLKKD